MDWDGVIEKNREALTRVVASLVAMAGLGNRQSAIGSRQSGSAQAAVGPTAPDCLSPTADCSLTLARHLHRAVLRLLRPTEAAVRRLVIVAARNVVLPPTGPSHPRKPGLDLMAGHSVLRSLGIAVVLPDNLRHPELRPRGGLQGEPRRTAGRIALPLFDPLRIPRLGRRRTVPPHAAPRILSFDGARPHRLPPPPAPDDPIDATRLALRLSALSSVLDDLPKHARRFARWRSRRDRTGSSPVNGAGGPPKAVEGARNRVVRHAPLRPGRPPGLSAADRRRPAHEVHEVLGDLQYFAVKALEPPDTS